ncbi:MAG TPA: maleylacetoacetate isomerase [Caulobacteraceae bacterium]|jgi:maleylpyruvate isomerase
MILHGYFRSGASYRTRIALNVKGLAYEQRPVALLKGEQRDPAYTALNPQGLVPALEVGDLVLTQSPAILEWLEETHPEPPLLPRDPAERARLRAICALLGCDVQPLNNLRILRVLREDFGQDQAGVNRWAQRWIKTGFDALERLLEKGGSEDFCHGDSPTLADCYLVPQVYSATRFEVDLDPYPRIRRIDEACARLEAFSNAHPSRQPDAA